MSRFSEWWQKRFHVSQTPPGWVDAMGGYETTTGISVNPDTAITSSAVYACVRILAETVASLPLFVYERLEDGGKDIAVDHPLYRLLHDAPNPEMTSFEWRETMMGHLALWGNAYSQKIYNGAGVVAQLWPLNPSRMTVSRVDGALSYTYLQKSGAPAVFTAEDILHIRGMGSDGIVGYSPIYLNRNAIGLGMATEEFGSRFFANDARPGIILKHPATLGDTAYKNLKKSVEREYKGVSQSHKMMILEEGMDFKEIGIPPEDAQFLQTRRFQIEEICRIYRVPPHMVGDLERATFSNIEQQSINFVVNTIRPWLVRWEQSLLRSLFTEAEMSLYFPEFLVDGLLRGDIQSRYAAYATARQNGWMSANDVRMRENMNPIEGGDVYLIPLNMVPADQAGVPSPAGEGNAAGAGRNLEPRRHEEHEENQIDWEMLREAIRMGEEPVPAPKADITVTPNITINLPDMKPEFTVEAAPVEVNNLPGPEVKVNVEAPNVNISNTIPQPEVVINTAQTVDVVRDDRGRIVQLEAQA